MGETRELAEFLAKLKYEDMPTEVVEKAKRLILDYLGTTTIAYKEKPAQILFNVLNRLGLGPEESTILGFGVKASSMNAAFLNGLMGHQCEMDDTHRTTMSHPGDSIIPSAMAVAEAEKASGKDFITAVVAGYDAGLRVGDAVCPSHYDIGWHTTGTIMTFGCGASAGKLLGFDADQMENLLGLVGVQVAGIFGPKRRRKEGEPRRTVMTKDLRPGKAAMTGVLSAILTTEGFTGDQGIFEGETGFCNLYSDTYDLNEINVGLGEKFKIMEVAHKPWQACRYLHGAIDATLYLKKRYNLTKDNVKEITVTGYHYVYKHSNPDPPTIGHYGPRFSMEFQVAHTIAEGWEGKKRIIADANYALEKLKDPEIRELMKKVKMVHEPKLDALWPNTWTAIVEIETYDGKKYKKRCDLPYGEPEKDITIEYLHEKFKLVASQVLSEKKVEAIIKTVTDLEELDDITRLTTFFIP